MRHRRTSQDAVRQPRFAPMAASIAAIALSALLIGCGPEPTHTARIYLSPGQTMALAVEGEQPTVQLAPDFGPLKRVDWLHPDGTTTFNGVPAGGDLLLTLRQGDVLRFTDELGSRLEITLWGATGYTLTIAEEAGTEEAGTGEAGSSGTVATTGP